MIADPDVGRDFCAIITSKGYPCEKHFVKTDDGYILTTFRIPNPKSTRVALLFHGLVDCSFTWIVNMPSQSLAYILYDAGYDVWMGNARGNRYARNHTSLDPTSPAFWDFNWDQQAQYDVPNTIDYILQSTGESSLYYVGHSQGTTQMFAALTTGTVPPSKIRSFIALAPVATVGHMNNSALEYLAMLKPIELLKFLGVQDFLGPTLLPPALKKMLEIICYLIPRACLTVIELWVGPTTAPLNSSRVEVISAHEPGGTSVQNLQHWLQLYNSGAFQMFDYGVEGNKKRYGQPTAPLYQLGNFPPSVPLALFTGGQDQLGDPIDTQDLIKKLPMAPGLHVDIPSYAHLDFVWSLNANTLIYSPALKFMAKF